MSDMAHITIVDDDEYIRGFLEQTLAAAGFRADSAASAEQALEMIRVDPPDLLLLDLMLPHLSGEGLLEMVKDIPVIVVSAKTDINSKVGLLLGGAADYITKPFETSELIARIKVALRKSGGRSDTLKFKDLTFFPEMHIVKVGEAEIRLTRTECAILKLLMNDPNVPVARSRILEGISRDTPDCTERSLKQHICNIRKKLQAVSGVDYIEAVYGIGFKMRA